MELGQHARHLTQEQPLSTVADGQYERDLLAKVRWRLIPFMFVLYIVACLDRVNIGFAALQMNRDLALTRDGAWHRRQSF